MSHDDSGNSRAAEREYRLECMTWPYAEERFRESDTALLPVGAVEQHGPHLPLDTDAWDAEFLCHEVARRCSNPKPIVLPLVPYGVSYHHEDFPGTLSVNPATLSRVVHEIGLSAVRHGITKLVIVNGHGGNAPALQFAAQMINRDAHIFTCVDTGESSDADIAGIADTLDDVHAGEIETSTALATRPDLVDMSAAEKLVPEFETQYLRPSSARSIPWFSHTEPLSPSGVLGDPTRASAEKGRQIWDVQIKRLLDFVQAIKDASLSQIHDRRI